MPDLLREQFPHLRPIVEAFGYRNLEFEGWEADDVIATLATRADEAGVKTCVVSTDRDAFQLCTENVCLMMTPRGVADVHVYTPERVARPLRRHARAGARLHRPQGRHVRQHPRRPGNRRQDRRAARSPSTARSRACSSTSTSSRPRARSRSASTPTRRARRRSSRRCGATSPLDVDPAALVLAPPDRSQLKEIFRRFEFRNLLGRVDELDEALPAAPMAVSGVDVPWREGELEPVVGPAALAVEVDRFALARDGEEVVVGSWSRELAARLRDAAARRPRREGGAARGRRRHAAHGLPDRPGPLVVPPRRPRGRVRRRAASRSRRPTRRPRRSSAARPPRSGSTRSSARGSPSAASTRSTAPSSCR